MMFLYLKKKNYNDKSTILRWKYFSMLSGGLLRPFVPETHPGFQLNSSLTLETNLEVNSPKVSAGGVNTALHQLVEV